MTRLIETAARGSMIETIVIIKKAMMICMLYWMNAIILPTCSVPMSI